MLNQRNKCIMRDGEGIVITASQIYHQVEEFQYL